MLTASGMEGLWLRFQIVCPLWKLTVSFAIPPLIPGYQKGSIAVLKVTIWNLSFFKNKSKKDCAMKSHRLKNWSISPHLSHYSLTYLAYCCMSSSKHTDANPTGWGKTFLSSLCNFVYPYVSCHGTVSEAVSSCHLITLIFGFLLAPSTLTDFYE